MVSVSLMAVMPSSCGIFLDKLFTCKVHKRSSGGSSMSFKIFYQMSGVSQVRSVEVYYGANEVVHKL